MSNDRTVRRLTVLEKSASSARVLNLVATHRRLPDNPDLAAAPLFRNRLLDRSIILKHRLRPHERDQVFSPRPTATKLLIPIDSKDLRLGARFLFVKQRDFDAIARSMFGDDLAPGAPDRRTLDLIDGLPSLDPFLLREHLKRHEIEPARAYFGISDADLQRMHDFVRDEILALVALSSGGGSTDRAAAGRLVDKLLSDSPDCGFAPLQATLNLSDKEYRDGVFAWRGFLYYKWSLGDLVEPMARVSVEVSDTPARGPKHPEADAYLPQARTRVQQQIGQAFSEVRSMISVYDRAYVSLTRDGKPKAFRDFLLKAPGMFSRLGERLGAVHHVTSFWAHRFPKGRPRTISPEDLMDLFLEFEDALDSPQEAEEAQNAWVI